MKPNDTLCLYCGNACNSGCTWSAFAQPVDGWTAQKTRMGWLVIQCPEFVDDTKYKSNPQNIDNDGAMKLLEAMMRQMREDYVYGRGPYKKPADNRRAIEKFLLGDRGKKMLQLQDPEEVIKQLRTLASRHDTQMMRRQI